MTNHQTDWLTAYAGRGKGGHYYDHEAIDRDRERDRAVQVFIDAAYAEAKRRWGYAAPMFDECRVDPPGEESAWHKGNRLAWEMRQRNFSYRRIARALGTTESRVIDRIKSFDSRMRRATCEYITVYVPEAYGIDHVFTHEGRVSRV